MKGAILFSLLAGVRLAYGNAFALPAANPDASPTAAPLALPEEKLNPPPPAQYGAPKPVSKEQMENKDNKENKENQENKVPAQTNGADFPPYQGQVGPIQTPFPGPGPVPVGFGGPGPVPVPVGVGVGAGVAIGQPLIPGQLPTPIQPLPFQPTASTSTCFNGGCQSIYLGPGNAAYTIPDGFGGALPLTPASPYQFNGLCQTLFNNGFQTVSCLPQAPFGNGNCNTYQNLNGIANTACNGFYGNPCFTFYNNGQQQVTCTPTTTAQIFFTTSTQSFCNTFINGGATTTSCTTNYFTSATRTSISIINAAERTGVPRALVGQAVAGLVALGAAAVL